MGNPTNKSASAQAINMTKKQIQFGNPFGTRLMGRYQRSNQPQQCHCKARLDNYIVIMIKFHDVRSKRNDIVQHVFKKHK